MNSFTIFLKDVRFDARVGIMPQEQIIDQPLSVSIEVRVPSKEFEASVSPPDNSVSHKDNLEKTDSPDDYLRENLSASISYADLYELLSEEMRIGGGLLETIAVRLSRRVQELYPSVKDGVIEIRKLNPPISGISGEAGIKYFFEKS